ncbi:DUF2752 domain-containing protein [Sphingobacterium cellulitidis]|uniref:DUF2752 domain-containing protein n=1 Tax=Sphingobacterium cellulitidis TaxID=1768011 RepID=UPI003C7C56E3
MINSRNRLYITTVIVCFVGIIWLFLDYYAGTQLTLCPVKLITGYPCPSCGTTRSISALLHGHLWEAILINPLGLISLAIILVFVVLVLIDLVGKKSYYYEIYHRTERYLQQHKVLSVFLIILVIANWLWNISKGL